MSRRVESVRMSASERRLLETVARRQELPLSTWVREAALQYSISLLEEELDDLRPAERAEP